LTFVVSLATGLIQEMWPLYITFSGSAGGVLALPDGRPLNKSSLRACRRTIVAGMRSITLAPRLRAR